MASLAEIFGYQPQSTLGYQDVAGNTFNNYQSALESSDSFQFSNPDQYGSLGASELVTLQPDAIKAPAAAGDTTLGLNNSTWGTIGTIGQLGTGLANAYMGYKNLGLAEDTFAFNKDMMNKQYAMAKDDYDRQVARSSSIGTQMNAGKVS